MSIDEKAFEKTWEENKLPILTNKMQFRRHIEAYEAAKASGQPDDWSALKKAVNRAHEMLKVAGTHAHQFGSMDTSFYDGVQCDGACVENDAHNAAQELDYQFQKVSATKRESIEVPFRIADHVEAMSEIIRLCKHTMKLDATIGKPWTALDKINRIASRQLLLMKTPMQDE